MVSGFSYWLWWQLKAILESNKIFAVESVDLISYCKAKFYKAFNGLFHRAAKLHNELTTLHLVSSYCRPHLLYATECLSLSVTQRSSLQHTWQCAVSHIFNVRGADVNFICSKTEECTLSVNIVNRNRVFLHNLFKLHDKHSVLYKLFLCCGQNELYRLNALPRP